MRQLIDKNELRAKTQYLVGIHFLKSLVAISNNFQRDFIKTLNQSFGLRAAMRIDDPGEHAHALPVVKIMAPEGAYDYQNKYFTDDVKYQCPSGLPEAEEREIQRIVVQAYRTLGCRGWGRADLMIRASDRKPFLLEMNTSPGMTTHSLVPMSARAAGLSYEALCVQILSLATLDAAPSITGSAKA